MRRLQCAASIVSAVRAAVANRAALLPRSRGLRSHACATVVLSEAKDDRRVWQDGGKWLAGRHRHRRHLHRPGRPAAVDRRSALDQGADPAQRSRRQHPGRARRRRPRGRGGRRPRARHDPGDQRHRRGPASSRWRWWRPQGFEDVLDIGRAGRQHLYRLDLPPRRAPRCRPSGASAWPSASIMRARPCWRPMTAAIAEAVARAKATGVRERRGLAASCLRQSGARTRARRRR